MKENKKQRLFIKIAVLFLVVMGLVFIPKAASKAQAEEFKITPGCFNTYTNSPELYNETTGQNEADKIVFNYPQYFETRHGNNNTNKAYTDEWLLKIVPRQVFQYPDEYFYIGKAYGFYVHAQTNTLGTTYYVNLLKTTLKAYETNGVVLLRLEPLFSQYYQYDAASNTVKPVPHSVTVDSHTGFGYDENDEMFLKDVGFYGNLSNINHANLGQLMSGTDVYDANRDQGAFFMGSNYVYNGVGLQHGKDDAAKAVLSFAVGKIPGASQFGKGLSVKSLFGKMNASYLNEKTDFRDEIGNDKLQMLDIRHMGREAQLQNYHGLIKDAGSMMESADSNPTLFGRRRGHLDNYVQTQFFINPETAWSTRMAVSVTMSVVREIYPDTDTSAIETYREDVTSTPMLIDLGTEAAPEVALDGDPAATCYALPYGAQELTFTPKYSGRYELYTEGNQNTVLEIYQDADRKNPLVKSGQASGNARLTAELTGGKPYYLTARLKEEEGFAVFRLRATIGEIAEWEAKTYTVDPALGKYYIAKFIPNVTAPYSYDTNQASVVMDILNDRQIPINLLSAKSLTERMEAGNTYYLLLTNNSNAVVSGRLTPMPIATGNADNGLSLFQAVSKNHTAIRFRFTKDMDCALTVNGMNVAQVCELFSEGGGRPAAEYLLAGGNRIINFTAQANTAYFMMIRINTASTTNIGYVKIDIKAFDRSYDWVNEEGKVLTGRHLAAARNRPNKITLRVNGIAVPKESLSLKSLTGDSRMPYVDYLEAEGAFFADRRFPLYDNSDSFTAKFTAATESGESREYRLDITVTHDYSFSFLPVSLGNDEIGFHIKTQNVEEEVTSCDVHYQYTGDGKSETGTARGLSRTGGYITVRSGDQLKNHKISETMNVIVTKIVVKRPDPVTKEEIPYSIYHPDYKPNSSYAHVYAPSLIRLHSLFGAGEGTEANPYLISGERHLNNLRKNTAFVYGRSAVVGHYSVISDIALTQDWEPIRYFAGTLNGNNRDISGMYVVLNGAENRYGFIRTLDQSGKLNRISMKNGRILGSSPLSVEAGGLVAYNEGGDIFECNWVGGHILVNQSNSCIGGVVGRNDRRDVKFGTVRNCHNIGWVTGGGTAVGGVVGENTGGTAANCGNNGQVQYTHAGVNGSMGGVAGVNLGTVQDCRNEGLILWHSPGKDTSILPNIGYITGRAASDSVNTGNANYGNADLQYYSNSFFIGKYNQGGHCLKADNGNIGWIA